MKKLLIIAFGIFLFPTVKTQAQLYVQGGVNFANISNSNSGSVNSNKTLTTFNAGLLWRSNASVVLAFESGLLLDGRGSKVQGGSGGANYNVTFNPFYLELPVNLIVRVPLGSASIFINGGPYIAMGIAGKSKFDGQLCCISGSHSEKIEFTSADPTADDQAYSIGAGVGIKKVLLKVNYEYGLAKIHSNQTDNSVNDKDKYRTWSISLGIPLTH